MAEAAFLAVGKSVVSKLADLVAQDISLACCAKEELRKLQDSLGTINATLEAFEAGQYVRTLATDNWLEKLKDVAYDADDVLDEFATEVSRQQMEQICFGTLDEVCEFSSRLLFNFKMGCQIKEIRKRLDNIKIDKNDFLPTHPIFPMPVANNETSPSLSNPSSVIGRNEEKDDIVKLLMEFERDNAQNVPIIPIVGMGGVGKTTLAKFVFNDKRVKEYFDLRIWVYVSKDFDAKTIAKGIIENITEKKCDELQLGVVECLLGKQLDGKMYLLVLDDVWNEDHDKWVPVKELFQGAKEGSRILVTTRSNQVASVMSPTSPTSRHLLLGPLSNDIDCWSVFKQRAFSEGEEEKYKKTLVPIGEVIVRKCQGVPLAITALGSLLHSNTDESYWTYVRDSEIWKLTEDVNRNKGKSINIMPILKFSYDHLPPHLKACFAYCSLFPKDHEIDRETLIYLWMANGLIQPSTRPMEDVGNEYFHILLSRTFFQVADEFDDIIMSYKMHDLMHDLARSISGTEYLIAPPQGSARHIFLSGDQLNPQLLNTTHKSRTLIKAVGVELPYDKCLSFKHLRALDLSWSKLERLPDSIGELTHLRYLNLSYSRTSALPDSFSRLLNLQTLIVSSCGRLRELPKDIWKMVKLRHISNYETDLTHMPSGLGQLTSLQTLWEFVVGDNIGGRISELGPLHGLRGYLCIQRLNHVTDPADAGKARLDQKKHLNSLRLEWDSEDTSIGREQDDESILRRQQHDERILKGLHPHPELKRLEIYGYAGAKFPYWKMSSLDRLVVIELQSFSGCKNLSALGDLPSLQLLNLEQMPDLECIRGGFTSLEKLYLDDLPKLEQWEGQFLCLATLNIKSCPSLVEMPFFPSLETWKLEFSRGELLLRSMTSNPTSSTRSGIPKLKSLQIYCCEDLECLPAEGLRNLEDLSIEWCSSLQSLSEDVLQHLSALRSLSIRGCPMTIPLPISPYITHLSIRDCPNAAWLEAEADENLTGFTSLQNLSIDLPSQVVSLPDALQRATSLQSLTISHCDGLTTIPEWLTSLASLQELVLYKCPLLTSLPEGMERLTRLQNLKIGECPHLQRRCRRRAGEDRAKIAHVPNQDLSYVGSSDLSDEDFSEVSDS